MKDELQVRDIPHSQLSGREVENFRSPIDDNIQSETTPQGCLFRVAQSKKRNRKYCITNLYLNTFLSYCFEERQEYAQQAVAYLTSDKMQAAVLREIYVRYPRLVRASDITAIVFYPLVIAIAEDWRTYWKAGALIPNGRGFRAAGLRGFSLEEFLSIVDSVFNIIHCDL